MCWTVIHSLLDDVRHSAARDEACSPACFFSPLQAYVFNRDIYYMPSVTSKPLRLTNTDQERHVVNGLSDWTYEGGMCSGFSGR